jgi:hypothetical protein
MWTFRTRKPTDVDVKFLSAFKRTRRLWSDEKQFTKVVRKMQQGKSLRTSEFYKVQYYLRKYYKLK